VFDAGAIEAHLDVRMDLFDRKMTAAEERVRKFEREGHKIRLDATFDNASLGRARQIFAQLDNQLSRDAMTRLRSSPQGSVLGALSAMLHPGTTTGAPTPSQSATQGAVGRTVREIDRVAVQQAQAQPQQTQAQQARAQRGFLSGLLAGGIAGGAGGGGGGGGGGPRASSSFLGRLIGGIGPNILGIPTRATLIGGGIAAGLGGLPALVGGLAPAIGLGGAAAAGLLFKGIQSQISPASQALQRAQQAQAAATTPAQVKAAAQAMASAQQQIRALPAAMQQILKAEQQIQDWWKKFTTGFAPTFARAITLIPPMLNQLQPVLHQFFANALTVANPLIMGIGDLARIILPDLGKAFAAAAPLLRPFLDGIGLLVQGLLGGLITLLHAAGPAVKALSGGLADIGRGIGMMFAQFAPVIKASSTILAALFDVISALFPIIGALAGVFARTLAPVFVTFAGVVRQLLPFLVTIGKVVAALAGAILGDLVAAFTAVAQILVAVSPALNAFAMAFSQIFTVLENTGVFAILGDALEGLVKPIATLINALLRGLTPLLPPIIGFISKLSGILITGLVQAVSAVLPPLTQLATVVLAAVAQILPIVLPLLTALVGIFTAAVVHVVSDLATALSAVLAAIPPPVLKAIVDGVLAIWAAMKLWAAIQAILDIEISATPIGLLVIAIVAVTVAVVEFVKHWRTIWAEVKRISADVWHFLDDIFHNKTVHTILSIWSLGLIPLAEHWRTVWRDIRNVASDFWGWLSRIFGTDIKNFFTRTIPGWWNTCYQGAVGFGRNIKSTFNDVLHWFHQVFGTDVANFFTKTLPNMFGNAVNAIGRAWGKVQNAIASPIRWVSGHIIQPLFNGIDAVTNFVGLGRPLQGAVNFLKGMATGGKITQGTHETADDVLIRASRNETVLSAAHSRILAPLLARLGVPGYASGGLVNPIGRGARPERVDMGVDYGGFFPLYALGSGMITNVNNSGWPGGTFIDLRLNPPYGSGYWYYAEDIMPAVRVGQSMSAGQLIGHAYGGPSGIEVGWASGVGGQTMAAAQGQDRAGLAHGDPGAFPTAWGIAASNLIGSLGGPRGLARGPIQGGTAGLGSIIKTIEQIFSGLGRLAKTAINIAKGNVGGALNTLLGLFPHGAGGAGGTLGKLLTRLPSTLASDAIKGIVSAVKGFVSGQQAGGGVGNVAATGPIQQYARKLVDAMWGDGMWPFFADIVRRESGWRVNATNPNGGAYGIPQALPGSKMASAGADWRTNPYTQLRWMVGYIKQMWQTPARADANEVRNHWYGNGGAIREPVIGYGTKSGHRYIMGESGTEWLSKTPPRSHMGGAGAMIGSVHIQLPEGKTVAGALSDVTFWLNVAKQQGYAGVLPGG
jgi:hypothetical protein